jgi:hypothetical protein
MGNNTPLLVNLPFFYLNSILKYLFFFVFFVVYVFCLGVVL